LKTVADEIANLEQEIHQNVRRCRIKFIMRGKVIHTSPEYNSSNSWSKIIAYARSARGGAPAHLPIEAAAVRRSLLSVAGRTLMIIKATRWMR
jgi:hypothetical protein